LRCISHWPLGPFIGPVFEAQNLLLRLNFALAHTDVAQVQKSTVEASAEAYSRLPSGLFYHVTRQLEGCSDYGTAVWSSRLDVVKSLCALQSDHLETFAKEVYAEVLQADRAHACRLKNET
jgi:hypothetical protein